MSAMQQNPFVILSLELKYNIDLTKLEQSYFKAQLACHPDRFVGHSAVEQAKARDQSAVVNAAYQSLKDPVNRAAIIMKVNNIAVPGEGDNTTQNPEALMEAMELRERLGELKSPDELNKFSTEIKIKFEELQSEFEKALQYTDAAAIQKIYLDLSFYAKLIKTASNQYQKLSVKIR